jgi:murein DD-endopeptidase MepM/ murein hydrolase activator NlpD
MSKRNINRPTVKTKGWFRSLLGRLFCKRTVIVIAEHKTQHMPISAAIQVVAVVAVLGVVTWGSFSTGSYVAAQQALAEKDRKLANKTSENERIGAEFSLLRRDLMKLVDATEKGKIEGEAKLVVEQYAQEENGTLDQEAAEKMARAEGVDYSRVFERIAFLEDKVHEIQERHNLMISEIKTATAGKIKELNTIIAMTGVSRANLKKQFEAKLEREAEEAAVKESASVLDSSDSDAAKGGPYTPADMTSLEEMEPELHGTLNDMIVLNGVVEHLPLASPLRVKHRLTSRFGNRRDPFHGKPAFHAGLDFVGPKGAPILATSAGTVIFSGWRAAYGRMVEIDHGLGFTTRYAHMSATDVEEGQQVEAGQRIGAQGSSGRSTGSHLHYEVRLHNRALNPRNFIKAGQYVQENQFN